MTISIRSDPPAPDEAIPNPVTLQVFANLFASIADEMGSALCRAALGPNIKERRDFSCLICDSAGELTAQAAHIPVHLGSAPLSVRAALEAVEMRPGDVVTLNDPFRGGTHLPDITMIAPVFFDPSDERPAFFAANRAHHADVGGMSAGSMPISDEIFQEGIVIPPLRLVKEGLIDRDVLDLFLANVRTPVERRGDVEAQIASLHIGVKRLLEVRERYPADVMSLYANALKDHSEKIMRAALAHIPDGDYSAEDFLDGDGFSEESIPIRVTVRVRGEAAIVDFTDSPDQVRGNLNCVRSITLSAALYVFRLLLGEEIPANHGALRPLTILTRPGSLLDALPPAAVAGGNVETSQRIVDTLLLALAQALPDRIPSASQGTMNNLSIGAAGPQPGQSFAYYETVGGGVGAGPEGDGASGVHSHMTNTMNTPIEALEAGYPLLVERFHLRERSGGGGEHRGGDGIRRDIRLLRDATVTIISERRDRQPYGLNSGGAGAPGVNTLIRADRAKTPLPSKISFRGRAGDVISVLTPGGGGWGEDLGASAIDEE